MLRNYLAPVLLALLFGCGVPDEAGTAPASASVVVPGTVVMTQPGCARAGCQQEMCVEAGSLVPTNSACTYRPEMACMKLAICGHLPGSASCRWIATREMNACLASSGAGEPR